MAPKLVTELAKLKQEAQPNPATIQWYDTHSKVPKRPVAGQVGMPVNTFRNMATAHALPRELFFQMTTHLYSTGKRLQGRRERMIKQQ